MDDSLLWDQTIADQFFSVCKYLSHTGNHGIIQNIKKFKFCRREIEFVGFTILEDGIRPNDEMIQNIRGFPRPTNISGVCAWFGLTEQVAYAFSKAEIMHPIKHLLSKSSATIYAALVVVTDHCTQRFSPNT